MRTIRTTLLLSLPLGACVLNQPDATTDVALDTGSETTQVSGAASSSSSGDSSSSSGDSDSADASSSSGEPDPADSSSSTGEAPDLCGNGVVDPGEDCDGGVRNDECSGHETFTGGQLGCGPTCRFDTSACCEAPAIVPCDQDNDDPFNAIELDCDVFNDQDWGRHNAVPLAGRNLPDDLDPTSFRVFSKFGDSEAWTPRNGERALIITTGSLSPVLPSGALLVPPGAMKPGVNNENLDFKSGLAALANVYRITPAAGGGNGFDPFEDCVEGKDCSNTLQKQWSPDAPIIDLIYIDFEAVVPAGTHGYELDLAFFTAHFPQFNDKTYNDVFMVWAASELYVGNITYIHDGDSYQPMSLPALVQAGMIQYDGENASELSGTGFHGKDMTAGGATPWLTVAGPALPGESLTLAIAGFDAYDFLYDSAMIVDNFRWSCGGCELDVDCGLRLQQ